MSNLFRKGIDDCQQGLASPSSNERIMAVQGLTKVDDPRAIGLLVDALRDTSSEVRSAAATSLMILGDSRG
ncbi:MAG: HEAT repeat domain-containing protein, partial [Chloroflexi bacterium]|nr:HEAT repeat domain-containing protein [Chloroflexota bacterium]